MRKKLSAIEGCLIGAAVGDALGLSCEGLSKERQRKLFPEVDRYHFLFGKGMVSDDTEHACMTAQALMASAGEPEAFLRSLAWRLRGWLLGLPAGVGFATLRAILKLWIGIPPTRSGVYSAGNGAAMRSAILGVCSGDDPARLRELVRASTRLTHTDPKAELSALAVAVAAHVSSVHAARPADVPAYLAALLPLCEPFAPDALPEFNRLLEQVASAVTRAISTEAFAAELGLRRGVSGYIYHTLPVALHAWLTHPRDFREAVLAVIRCGGDTDTTAAIVGGIVGAGVGKAGIPQAWRDGLCEWPRSVAWMERLAARLDEVIAAQRPQRALPLSPFALGLRNGWFLLLVLAHGLRRLFPPY